MSTDNSSVNVAVRIRPQNHSELLNNEKICINIIPGEPQIYIGKENFTFDHVFDVFTCQEHVFDRIGKPLIDGLINGYNATIIAYGQTGSGKTFTMGTSSNVESMGDEVGIIPRALNYLFERLLFINEENISKGLIPTDFKISAQFLEIYNENIIDLLNPSFDDPSKKLIKVHESTDGNIFLTGVTSRLVTSSEDTLRCLNDGSRFRQTGSTLMNAQSSRSHAIFTLTVRQQRYCTLQDPCSASSELTDSNKENEFPEFQGQNDVNGEFETLTAKFHFVDLAGSERLHKTGATGMRAKEGISINCGLLALGNVISSLGDIEKRGMHVPYRSSKLTRLLQDSLGGNSRTVMIACVSPSDSNFVETLCTVRYANRAKNIKNKVTVNQDKTSKQMSILKEKIAELSAELEAIKSGKVQIQNDGSLVLNDICIELRMVRDENQNLARINKALHIKCQNLESQNANLVIENETLNSATKFLSQNSEKTPVDMAQISEEFRKNSSDYIKQIQSLKAELVEKDALIALYQKSNSKRRTPNIPISDEQVLKFAINAASSVDVEFPRKHKKKRAKIDSSPYAVVRRSISDPTDPPKVVNEEQLDDEEEDTTESSSETSSSEQEGLACPPEESQVHRAIASVSANIDSKEQILLTLQQKTRSLEQDKLRLARLIGDLNSRVKITETERDSEVAKAALQSEEKVRHVKETYEKKLKSMQLEIHKAFEAKQEQLARVKANAKNEDDMRKIRMELQELRKHKMDLTKQLRQAQSAQSKTASQLQEVTRAKCIADAQLKRLKDSHTIAMQRKNEEIIRLKRDQRVPPKSADSSSSLVRSRSVLVSSSKPASANKPLQIFTSRPLTGVRRVKDKWLKLNQTLDLYVARKLTIDSLQRDLNTWIEERELVSKRMMKLKGKLMELAKKSFPDVTKIKNLESDIASAEAQLQSTQEQIDECKENLVETESQLHTTDSINSRIVYGGRRGDCLFNTSFSDIVNLAEARTLLSQLFEQNIERTVELRRRENSESSLRKRLAVTRSELKPVNFEDLTFPEADEEEDEDNITGRDILSLNTQVSEIMRGSTETIDLTYTRVAHRSDCTCGCMDQNNTEDNLLESVSSPMDTTETLPDFEDSAPHSKINHATSDPEIINLPVNNQIPNAQGDENYNFRAPSAVWQRLTKGHRKSLAPEQGMIKNVERVNASLPCLIEEKSISRMPLTSTSSASSLLRQMSKVNVGTPPQNVTANSCEVVSNGSLSLRVTQMAIGHTKPVLDLDIVENLMLTGSSDRTAKLWDLDILVEIGDVPPHLNNVSKVKLSASDPNLFFTVCTYYVSVWDRRDLRQPANVLYSRGAQSSKAPDNASWLNLRQTSCPPGESFINDISLYQNRLLMACSNSVKLWDLRRLSVVGTLCGNQGPVMTVASSPYDTDEGSQLLVASGSKDHTIKLFSIDDYSCGNISPFLEVVPPHYDGIESITIHNLSLLFSSSRDGMIKGWKISKSDTNITSKSYFSIHKAHKDYVQLALLSLDGETDPFLVSGCKSGVLKVWSTSEQIEDSSRLLFESQSSTSKDNSINAIRTLGNQVFTAQCDNTVRIWKVHN